MILIVYFFRKLNFINMFERQSVHHTKDFKSIPIPDKCTTNQLTISKSYFAMNQNFKNSACRQLQLHFVPISKL